MGRLVCLYSDRVRGRVRIMKPKLTTKNHTCIPKLAAQTPHLFVVCPSLQITGLAGAYSMGINIAIATLFWRSCSTHICRPCRPVCNSCRPIADQLQTGLQTIADHLQPSESNLSDRSSLVAWYAASYLSSISNIKPSLNRQHIVTYYHRWERLMMYH